MITLHVQPRQSGKTSTLFTYLHGTDVKDKKVGLVTVNRHHAKEILETYRLKNSLDTDQHSDMVKSITLISRPDQLIGKRFDMILVDEYFYLKDQKGFYKHFMVLGHSGCKIYAWGTPNKIYSRGLINTIRKFKSRKLINGGSIWLEDAVDLLKDLFSESEVKDAWFNLITEPTVELIQKDIDKKKIWQEALEKMCTFEELQKHKPIHDFIFNTIVNAPVMPDLKPIK